MPPPSSQTTATLMVEKLTGAITGPVTSEQFASANDLGSATPTAHAATHAAAGDDPVTLAESQVTGLTAALAAKAAASDLTSHTSNTSNPHSVTKAQVGLSSADNTSDANKPVSTATQTALDLKADESEISTHEGRIAALENTSAPSPTGNALFTGGGVAQSTGLSVIVSAATYQIQGAAYASAQTTLTASAADPTNPRIDVVAVNSSGVAVIIEGTPAATPVKPDIDPTTQLELTFFIVAAGATSLAVNTVTIYDENDDYTMSENGTSIVLDSTNNPRGGTKTIEATSAGSGDSFQAQTASGTIDLGDYDNLIFFIRNKASWASAKQINITARSSGTQVGSSVTFKHGLFGFDQTNTTTYQQIVIPASLFAANGQNINQLRWAVAGGGAAIGFYVDDISLQGGLAPLVDATRLKWRGEWDSSLLNQQNDATKRSGIPFAALQSGVNKDPNTQPTYWDAMVDKARTQYFAEDAGANDTYTATLTPTPTAYVTGAHYRFKANSANTGACTINLNALGAKTIKKVAGGITTDLADNDIRAGQWVDLVYDGTNMQMQSLLGNAPSGGIGSPGGSDTQVQYNNAGALGGISGATSNGTTMTFGIGTLHASQPQITTGLRDANGEIILAFNPTASAVNRLAMTNAATGNGAILSTEGSDANIQLLLTPKGTGSVRISSANPSLVLSVSGTPKNQIASEITANALIAGSAIDDLCFRNFASKSIIFSADDGTSIGLKVAASTNQVSCLATTAATNATTGSLVTAGGFGCAGAGWFGGNISIDRTAPLLAFRVSGAAKSAIKSEDGAGNDITGSAVDDMCFRSYVNKSMLFSTDDGNTAAMKIEASTGRIVLKATSTTAASLNLPHGTAPTSPADGDAWTTTAGLFVRINGATVGPLS